MKKKSIIALLLTGIMTMTTVPAMADITHPITQSDETGINNIKVGETVYMPFTLTKPSRTFLGIEFELDKLTYPNIVSTDFTVTIEQNTKGVWKALDKKYSFTVTKGLDSYTGAGIYGLPKGSYRYVYKPTYPTLSLEYHNEGFKAYKTTKKNAVKAKKNACMTALFTEKNNKTCWYKFTNKKNQKIYLSLSGTMANYSKMKLTLYNKKGKKIKSGTFKYSKGSLLFSKKLKKGTYYASVKKVSKASNGETYFAWNNRK